jgi:hypothetical protein
MTAYGHKPTLPMQLKMTALGHKRTSIIASAMSAFGRKADMSMSIEDVRP